MSDQMPGPFSFGFEQGFDPIGSDMSGLAAPFAYPVGVALPGDALGYQSGENMHGMASLDGFPQGGGIGSYDNDGVPDHDGDLASSAGYRIIGALGNDASWAGLGDVTAVFNALESNSGEHGSSVGGPVHGHDSMRGLVVGDMPAPVGEQDIR